MKKKEAFAAELADVLIEYHGMTVKAAEGIKRSFGESDTEAFDDFLLEEGLIEKEDLLDALSRYYKVPSFDVDGYFFQTMLLHEFPKDFLLRHEMIPLEVDEDILVMVTANPLKDGLMHAIGDFVSYDVTFYVGITRDICDAVKEFYDKSVTQVQEDESLDEEHDEEREADRILDGEED